jgi:hypothetical protein
MVRLFAPISLLLVLVATACTGGASSSGSAATAAPAAPAATQAPPQAAASGWTHPLDVTPLTDLPSAGSVGGKAASGAGAFQVISQTPWPGNKVRIFFFGVQG